MLAQISYGLGIIILLVSAVTGGTLLLAPGSIRLQRPECGWVGWTFNIMNLLFFMIIIPICGVLLINNNQIPDFISLTLSSTSLQVGLEIVGIIIFLFGSLFLLWSRLSLRRSFRLAGVKPTQTDYLTMHGPYQLIRHPMYISALLVLFGITLILVSILMAFMFLTMLSLILKLIPKEEAQLNLAYPIAFSEYCRRVPGTLFPSKPN
ncbi:MAG: methyltransferase [Candidatus Marinimicrobia bacterium]|nr:methyltransferase [Candidatus Neomarinimicrobiota bacterium]